MRNMKDLPYMELLKRLKELRKNINPDINEISRISKELLRRDSNITISTKHIKY